MVPDIPHDLPGNIQDLFGSFVDCVGPLNLGCRNKDVDHVHVAVKTRIYVLLLRSGEAADKR
jgi:hypothetical protein